MSHVELRGALQELGGEVRAAAAAGRGEVELPRLRARHREEVLHVLHRERHRNDEHVARRQRGGDAREIAQRVVGELRVYRGRDGVGGRDREQGVPVGRGFRDDTAAYRSARARAVVDDDLLPDPLGELYRYHARGDIGLPAGRETDDDADRPVREC